MNQGISIIVMGVIYMTSFVCLAWLTFKGKDTNVFIGFVTAALTALAGLINIQPKSSARMDTPPETTPVPMSEELIGGTDDTDYSG